VRDIRNQLTLNALCVSAFSALPSYRPPAVPTSDITLESAPVGTIGRVTERAVARPDERRRRARGHVGLASYYARHFDGRTTASGRRFDNDAMLAGHPTYPFGTVVRVTNLRNRRAVNVRIVDRGPARGPRADGVIIDVSRAAAEALGFIRAGRTRVRVDVLRSAAT
jgi:rare lipoprotein A